MAKKVYTQKELVDALTFALEEMPEDSMSKIETKKMFVLISKKIKNGVIKTPEGVVVEFMKMNV